MPQYLYRIQPTRPAMLVEGLNAFERQTMNDHFHYVERLRDAGQVILAGRTQNTDPTSFGIVIFEAASDADAEVIVHNDPSVACGVVRSELFPYSVALICEANVHDE